MRTEFYIGRNRRGDRVYITTEIRDTDRGRELSVVGHVVPKYCRKDSNAGSFGQIVMEDDALPRTPLGNHIRSVWERWHLNTMRAECEHQRARGETYASHSGAVCPDCGYRLGRSWLTEPLPDDIIADVESWPERAARALRLQLTDVLVTD